MIVHLKGRLDSFGIDHAVIDVGGVGYLVGASARTLSALGPIGEACTVFTELLVGEDFQRLVGNAQIQAMHLRTPEELREAFDHVEIGRAHV